MLLRPLLALAASLALVTGSSVERNPLRLVQVVEDATISTPSRRVTAVTPKFDILLHVPDERLRLKLSLEPNHDILHEDAFVTHLGPDGEIVSSRPINRLEHKIFRGTTFQETSHGTWQPVGWARIHVHRDGPDPVFEGAFSVNHDAHHVQLSSRYMSSKNAQSPSIRLSDDDYMVVWRDSDAVRDDELAEHVDLRRSIVEAESCQSDNLRYNNDLGHPVFSELLKRSQGTWGAMPIGSLFGKRQSIDSQPGGNSAGVNLVSTIGDSSGCPSTRKVALVGVATDCTYTATFADKNATEKNVITVMNSASEVWERSFNISLGLRNLTVSDARCPGTPAQTTMWNQNCDANLDILARLNLFSAWRGTVEDNNSHWTLLSNCPTGSAVGLAWLGQACIQRATTSPTDGGGSETVSGANFVAKTDSEWQVVAHETGHTFGAVHDCTDDTCGDNTAAQSQCCPFSANTCPADGRFIMNPSTSLNANTFSPCTVGNICSALGRNSVHSECLSDNKGVTTYTGQVCGNGIVEDGEDCDCGGPDACGDNPCCDPRSCQFRGNAVCDDSNEDCCRGCQLASAQTVCRASTSACDPEEVCTGTSANCPADQSLPDGQACSLNGANGTATDHNLRCASGQCTSRDLQCKLQMGSVLHSNDTYACDSPTCLLTCSSPNMGSNQCASLNTYLRDGTPCGGGGHCSNGNCEGGSFGGDAAEWVNNHRGVVIGVASAVGGIVLLLLLSCLWSCCKRGRRKRALPAAPPMVPPHASPPFQQQPQMSGAYGPGVGGWYAPAPPPHQQPPSQQQQQQQQWEQPNGWRPPPASHPASPSPAYMSPAGAPPPPQANGGQWYGPAPPPMSTWPSQRYA